MKNTEILERLAAGGETGQQEENEERTVKFLVFDIRGKKYALHAEDIREIVMDIPVFYIPFVPPYIRGLINRHGEPYTVFDLNVLFEKEKQDSSTYLILNLENDQLAFLISDIREI